jgi:hypothetical protein
MSLESPNHPNEMNEPTNSTEFPVHGWWKIFYGLFVVVMPTFSFWAVQIIAPEWQSGDRQAYLALLLSVEASLIFLVLLSYSILCYLLLLIAPRRFAEFFLIRLGVYSGVPLAFQYCLLLFLYLFDNKFIYAIIPLWLFPLYFPPIYHWMVRRWNTRLVGYLLGILILVALALGYIVAREFLFFIIVALVIAAPFWSLLIALQATFWLYQNEEVRDILPRGLGVTAWVASYVAAWRYDILKMYELYAQLPPVPPNCYIATAAAHGHPAFVGAWTMQLADGKSMQVNRQLQVFKCAELALLAVAPRAYKILRKTYDFIGKRLARMIHRPLLADGAYLILKPFEWLAGCVLRRIIGDIESQFARVYSK